MATKLSSKEKVAIAKARLKQANFIYDKERAIGGKKDLVANITGLQGVFGPKHAAAMKGSLEEITSAKSTIRRYEKTKKADK